MADNLNNIWPALLTGTIEQHPDAQAIWIDPRERELQYLAVLSQMANANNNVDTVLFCENSRAQLDAFKPLVNIYAKQSRTFQLCKVSMPDSQSFSGKGWGEGIIIKSALQNNSTLSRSSGFMKITGRYHVVNLKRIITIIRRGLRLNPNIKFVCQSLSISNPPEIETRFFWADTDFYREHMLDVYKGVKDEKSIFLEHVIADRLMQLKDQFEFAVLPIPVIVQGISGWDGKLAMSKRTVFKQEVKQRLLPLPSLIPFRDVCNSSTVGTKQNGH